MIETLFSPLARSLYLPVDLYFGKEFGEGDPQRALFLTHLLYASRLGHLCIQVDKETLFPSIHPELDPLIIEGAFEGAHVLKEGAFYFLKKHFDLKEALTTSLQEVIKAPPSIEISEERLSSLLQKEPLQEEQKEAIFHAVKRSFSLITGGPGTGKSYTAKVLAKSLRAVANPHIALAAPTGKAAANLRDLSMHVKTLHALVQESSLFPYDLLIVDEGSMIDVRLMYEMVRRMKKGARLVLLGDPYQLPPVEAGSLFSDLAGMPPLISSLTKTLRTELSSIIDLASCVKKGEMIPFQELDEDALFEALLDKLPLNEPFSMELFKAYRAFRLLTPLRFGKGGVNHLNEKVKIEHQRLLGEEAPIPLLITENDATLQLFNGENAFLVGEKVFFEDGRVLSKALLPSYEMGYALSVHKSQGSEYDAVWVMIPKGSEHFGREMLYTAITRAKKSVKIFTEKETLEQVLKSVSFRLSGLRSADFVSEIQG